jgi:hypothetical protein
MSVTWKEAGFRARDGILAVLTVAAVAALAVWNALSALQVAKAKSPRLRISAVAARPLEAGTVLREDDVVIRIRRVDPRSEFFDRTSQLIGRQLSRPVDRSEVLQTGMLVASCFEEKISFFIVVDGQAGSGLQRNDRVILTRAGKQEVIPTMPIFTIVNVVDIERARDDKKPAPDRRLELRADYAADAMRVLAAADDAVKFIPLRLERPTAPVAR